MKSTASNEAPSEYKLDDDNLEFGDDDNCLSFVDFLQNMEEVEEDILFGEKGYKRISTIGPCDMGMLYMAIRVNNSVNTPNSSTSNSNSTNEINSATNSRVTIKKICKRLANEKIMERDGITFCITQDVVKEAVIMQYLTLNRDRTISNYLAEFVDFFESETDYYLVTKHIDNGMKLSEFIAKSHAFIKSGRLQLNAWKKVAKFIMWQLSVTLGSLHSKYQCMFHLLFSIFMTTIYTSNNPLIVHFTFIYL